MANLEDELEELIRRHRALGVPHPENAIRRYLASDEMQAVKALGLRSAIVFTFLSPLILFSLKVYCAAHKIDVDLPEDAIMKFCLVNAGTVMAFGFGSQVHTLIKVVRNVKAIEQRDSE